MRPFPPDLLPQAECLDADTEAFFPRVGDNWVAQKAKALCRRCPIRTECGEWALANLLNTLEDCGIWGGMTANERKAERSRRGIKMRGQRAEDVLKPCGTDAAYRRHQRRGEKPCRTCLEAHNEESERRLTWEQRRRKAERQRQRRGAA